MKEQKLMEEKGGQEGERWEGEGYKTTEKKKNGKTGIKTRGKCTKKGRGGKKSKKNNGGEEIEREIESWERDCERVHTERRKNKRKRRKEKEIEGK